MEVSSVPAEPIWSYPAVPKTLVAISPWGEVRSPLAHREVEHAIVLTSETSSPLTPDNASPYGVDILAGSGTVTLVVKVGLSDHAVRRRQPLVRERRGKRSNAPLPESAT